MANPRFIKSERKLATIRQIAEVHPIDGADKIEMVLVDGWECVVKKDEGFKVGDSIVYIEIDSIVPDRPEFEFLRDRKFRVRTIKLRKQISQGLVLPLTILPDKKFKLGDDVTEVLGIFKYDPEAEKEREVPIPKPKSKLGKFLMKFEWYRKWRGKKYKKSSFPGWIAKTDETRVQNLVRLYNDSIRGGVEFFVTEKLDGQSFTAYIDDKNKLGICSRNLSVSFEDGSNYAVVFKKYNLDNYLKLVKKQFNAKRIVFQGEICGPGIQGNKYGFSELNLFIFNIIIDGKILNYTKMAEMTNTESGLKPVPLLEEKFLLPPTIKEIVDYSKGYSVVKPTQKREGVVIRSMDYKTSFKVINPEFLLEEKE